MIIIPLFKDHKILTQVAGACEPYHQAAAAAYVLSDDDCDWIESSFDAVIADAHKVPGAVWSLGKTLAGNAMKARAAAG